MLLFVKICLLHVLLAQSYEDVNYASLFRVSGIKLRNASIDAVDPSNIWTSRNPSARIRKVRADEECDCGAGTVSCFFVNDLKICKCDNEGYAVEGDCKDCKCPNALCKIHENKCTCLPGYSEGPTGCTKCECGDSNTCYFEGGHQLCVCGIYVTVNSKCEDCICPENEVCFFRNVEKTCDCTNGWDAAENSQCEDCNCETNLGCTYTEKVQNCDCIIPGFANLNGECVECKCGGTNKCEFEDGKKVCLCEEGFAENNGVCEECVCGADYSCSFVNGKKNCDCKNNYALINGVCHACGCLENEFCEYMYGFVTCECKDGYAKDNGICRECDCGPGHLCIFQDSKKVCICSKGYVYEEGICQECDCGADHACEIEGGLKICKCLSGYAEKGGVCEECRCEGNSTCLFEDGKKLCIYTPSHADSQINGMSDEKCTPDTCLRGECEENGDSTYCRCEEGYTGSRCEKVIFISRDAAVLITVISSLILFWIIFGAICVIKRRKRRLPRYGKKVCTSKFEDDVTAIHVEQCHTDTRL